MPTPSEQKALTFVAIVVLLAGAARVLRAGALLSGSPTPSEQQALARQAFAANSTATALNDAKAQKRQRGARLSRKRRDDVAKEVAGVAGVPFSDVRPGRPSWAGQATPPIGAGSAPYLRSPPAMPATPALPVDLDIATQAQIEALPRIGPALARRIVASRDSAGPFGSLERLRRVKGIGPATLRLLAPLVTFSGQTRP